MDRLARVRAGWLTGWLARALVAQRSPRRLAAPLAPRPLTRAAVGRLRASTTHSRSGACVTVPPLPIADSSAAAAAGSVEGGSEAGE